MVDDVVDSFEALLQIIIEAAELETTLKRLLEDIEMTKRRVNALEFKVIPELEAQRTYIAMRLEEMEREGIFGLKKIKEKGAAKAERERLARRKAEAGDAGDEAVAQVTA